VSEHDESERGLRIQKFLRAASAHARRRTVLIAGVDLLLIGAALGWIAAATAGATLRGDLVHRGSLWVALGFVVLRGILAARHIMRGLRADITTAKAVAATDGPLRRPLPSDPAPSPHMAGDRLLRHELVAAAELATAINADDAEHSDEQNRVRAAAVGSQILAERYIQDVERRLESTGVDPRWALPRPRLTRRLVGLLGVCLASGISVVVSATFANGVGLWVAGVDGRPPVPAEPVWSTMTLQLDYPAYTGRPRRVVPNPSGALRVPAGTEVTVLFTARRGAAAGRLAVNYDANELAQAQPPEFVELTQDDAVSSPRDWRGTFTARGSGTWTVVLVDDADDAASEANRRSPALPLSIEPDRPPEVELLPLPRDRQEVREHASVNVEFVARDDFGLSRAQLVYQLPDGTAHRLAVDAPADRRTWRRHYTWDISQIPISERSEVLYWLEVRDNDPGLGLTPLADPPGKRTRSATLRLTVRDDEAEHAANIVKLRDIRDFSVDVLALRMRTRAFETESEAALRGGTPPPLAVRAAMARDVLARSGELLSLLSEAIDALSMDSLAQERDAATLTKIHQRLAALHREALSLHKAVPPRSEIERPEDAEAGLTALRPHAAKELTQLEDEVIRLDDLVHGEIIERLEALVARLEATQRKLVQLLEQLAAGDTSVRAQIEQLELRRREDLRRIAEARAMLSQEVEQEFMNMDAFKALENLQRDQELSDMLARGDVDKALQQAQEQLGEIQGLRDQVQQRLGEAGPGPELSEEEKKRMKLLRELSRLQDDQGSLKGRTGTLHEHWREAVGKTEPTDDDRKTAGERAKAMQEALEEINDARLGRDGRSALQDAIDAAEQLAKRATDEDASALDLAESAEQIDRALGRAVAGSEASETEGKALRRAARQSGKLQEQLGAALPTPRDALPETDQADLTEMQALQRGLDKRAGALMDDPLADLLPPEGRAAMKRARRGMGGSADHLDALRPGQAVPREQRAWDAIQEAIDSLRQGSPPPPSASSGEASTETERDLSLRDQLMDAMREDAPSGFSAPVERYYEELLR